MLSYRFCFVLFCIWGQFPSYKPPGVNIQTGEVTEGFFALQVWRGLFSEFHGIFPSLFDQPCCFSVVWRNWFRKANKHRSAFGRSTKELDHQPGRELIFQHQIEVFANIFDLVHRIEGGSWEQDWHVAWNLSRVQFIRFAVTVCKNGWPLQSADAVRLEVLKWVHEESNFLL